MKVSLPTISALDNGSLNTRIESFEETSTGDTVFNYKFSIDAITNELLNNDVVTLKVSLLPQASETPTNDFKKIASGDLTPVLSKTTKPFSSLSEETSSPDTRASNLESFSGGMTDSDRKKVNFAKNSTISNSLLKSHMQLKQSITDTKISEVESEINSETISVDSIVNADAKNALIRSKMLSSIRSGTGDSISVNSSISDIFFDGGVKFISEKKKSITSSTAKSQSDIPVLDTFLIQKSSPSVLSNTGYSKVEYETDSSGNVVARSGVSNISQSTSQDDLSGILERSGAGQTGKSSIDADAQSASWSSMTKYGISPTQIIAMDISEIINTACDNYAGVSTKAKSSCEKNCRIRSTQLLKTGDISQLSNSLRGNLVKLPTSAPESISELSSVSSITTSVETTTEKSTFQFSLQVPQSRLSDPEEFIVVMDLVDAEGRTVQTNTKTINHKQKSSDLFIVKEPPIIEAFQADDSVVYVTLTQVDPNARKIILLRKGINQSTFSLGSKFKKISELKLKPADGGRLISILVPPGESSLLRAVAVSKSGELGTFSDTILRPAMRAPSQLSGDELEDISITSENMPTGILIESKIISGNPAAVYFLKRNITMGERIFTPMSTRDDNSLASTGKTFQLLDREVFDDHTYEYKCKIIFKNGSERFSSNSAIVNRQFVNDSISINSSAPIVQRSKLEEEYKITLNNDVSLPESDADTTRQIFDNLGLSELFSDEISSIKDQFNSLSLFAVTRFDVKTGIEYYLGVHPTGEFQDSGDARLGIPTPSANSEYIYKFESLIRTPDDIITEIKSTQPFRSSKESTFMPSIAASRSRLASESSGESVNQNFSQKFTSPTAIRQGTLSYGNSLAGNHSENSFEMGRTGVVKTVRVDTPAKTTSVVPKSTRVSETGDVLVKWSISGNLDDLDHFIILATRNGITIPVGTHHATSTDNSFHFTDTTQKGILGDVTYSVVPVFSNFTQGFSRNIGKISISREI